MKNALIVLLLAVNSLVQATTYYISPTGSNSNTGAIGSPWKTLYYACTRVSTAGDIIHVNAGTYIETAQSELAVGVSIEGDGNTSIIRSQVTADWSPTIALVSSVVNTKGNQHISNIRMEGSSQTAWGGIYIAGRGNVKINNCTFVDFKYTAVIFNGKLAMYEPGEATAWCTGNEFSSNIITNCAASFPNDYQAGALHIGAQEGMLIYNNTITENSRPALYNGYCIKYYNEGFNRGIKIYNNTLTKAPPENNAMDWNFAIELWNWRGGVEIYDNVIYGAIDVLGGSSRGPYAFQADIHHNTFGYTSLQTYNTSATNGGIYIEEDNTGPLYIHHNLFRNIGTPFQVYPDFGTHTSNTYIYCNVFNGIGTIGGSGGWSVLMACASSPGGPGGNPIIDNFNFFNNTVYVGSGGCNQGLQLPDMGTATNVSIRNNIFQGFQYSPVFSDISSGKSIDYLSVENNIFYGNGTNAPSYTGIAPTHNTTQNNKTGNPTFISSTDLHLQTGSPAINSGIVVSTLTTDYDGNAFNSPPSIGAFEYGTTPPPVVIPVYQSSAIKNATPTILEMTYDIALANVVPLPADFSVTVNGSPRSISSVLISGQKVQITLSSRVYATETVIISYTPGTNQIQSLSGGKAVSLSLKPVTNNCVNSSPSVIITAPGNGSVFTAPATVSITASASDIDGTISKVEFYSGSTKIGEKLTSPYSFTWNSVAIGTYSLTAVATDNLSATTTSAVISITVNSGTPPANQLPVASISSPANGAQFTAPATVLIHATASDPDGTVSKVEFFSGALKLGESATAPYDFSWTNVPAGNYVLSVVATDNLLATKTSTSVSIVVNPEPAPTNQSPLVSLSLPVNNSTFTSPATIIMTADASDPDGSISKVEFFNGTDKLGETVSAPYTYSWIGADVGTFFLTAVASDNLGATTTSAATKIYVISSVESAVDSINIYPNPGSGIFTISLNNPLQSDINTINIFNSAGKIVFKGTMLRDENIRQIDITSFDPGAYLLMIISKEIIATKKFIKM